MTTSLEIMFINSFAIIEFYLPKHYILLKRKDTSDQEIPNTKQITMKYQHDKRIQPYELVLNTNMTKTKVNLTVAARRSK